MLITPAYAQAAAGGDANSMLMSLLPFALIFVIMYFLILRPQQKKVKDHAELVKNIRRGDTVVTSGGLVGKVTKVVDDDQIEFEISDGVRVRQMRQMISGVRAKGEPAKEKSESQGRDVRELSFPRRFLRRIFLDLTGLSMLYFTRWKALAIILTALVVCLFAVPNFFPRSQGQDVAGVGAAPHRARPRFAGRLVFAARGRLQLREERKARPDARGCAADVARCQDRSTDLVVRNDAVEVRINKDSDVPAALTKLRELSQPLGGLLGSSGQRSLEVSDASGGLIRLTVPQAAITERIRQTIEQSIQIVERRINELGTVEPLIQRQGTDRILVQVPGLQDPTRVEAHPRQDRQDGIPHGRYDGFAGSGPVGAGAGRFGSPDERAIAQGSLCRQAAGAGVRRRADRCAAGLRPAHQRADRQLQVQIRARANSRRRRRRMSACRLRSSSTTR